jgi:hypothetical protein
MILGGKRRWRFRATPRKVLEYRTEILAYHTEVLKYRTAAFEYWEYRVVCSRHGAGSTVSFLFFSFGRLKNVSFQLVCTF